MRRELGTTIVMAALVSSGAGLAQESQDLEEITVKAIGLNSKTIVSFGDEKPFWEETIPTGSGGKITVEFAPIDLAGVKDPQIMRMTSLGVTDFGAGDISKMAGDNPVFEGCDLAGLALDIETARKACEAWAPVMGEVMEEQFNVKLLALGTNPPQVIWCRDELGGIEGLEGRKVRVFNKTMSDFINAVGGTTVSMPFAEVVPALQRGVVDCAVTGSLSGNTAGWPEVSDFLYPMYMGWSINYQSVNLDSWNGWPEAVQDFFVQEFDDFEDKMWATAARATADAENCNFGKEPCEMGKMADMTLVPVSEEDKQKHKQLMQDVVLVEWAKRCGQECAQKWNELVGPVVGLEIPLDQI